MTFTFDNTSPIYIQLVEQMKMHIISGRLSPGERIPSVRELALLTKVNPNTMQKALGELEDSGLIFTERTNGKFVTEDTELIESLRHEQARILSEKYLTSMRSLGVTDTEIVDYLTKEVNK
ncbi:MAG: GntR family transcriptional regulator [Ruminococcaceae bacterium]|nr:GntR family transcriptional regulator [Oscillospiraceae bacterium]